MDIKELHLEFNKIIEKYDLSSPENANKLTQYLTSKINHNAKELKEEFNLETIEEAEIILRFIQKGIEFKSNSNIK